VTWKKRFKMHEINSDKIYVIVYVCMHEEKVTLGQYR